MKVLALVIALFALFYSGETLPKGIVNDPSQLEPGYVLQPDGSYLKTIEIPGEKPNAEDGWVLQPDGSYLKTIEDPGTVENEDEYNPIFSNNILTMGNGKNKGFFKISRGDSNNKNDYSVKTVQSANNPTPLNSDDKDAPQVYQEGTQGKPDYQIILGAGKGPQREYLKMKPDSSKPIGFRFIPQYISGYTKVRGQVHPNVKEPTEDVEDDIPDNPKIFKKKGYSVITIGRPDSRRYVKLTPSKNKNAYDFDLKPIKHPDQPDSHPDADDDDAPEIIENGKRGTPDYQPVIASGPSDNRRYVGVVVNPKQPNRFSFVPAYPQTDTGEVTTEPNEDDVEFEDVPVNPKYTTVKVPGNKIPVGIVSVGHPAHRAHFKIVRSSNKPGDVQVVPIHDPDHLNSSPDPKNEYAPDVCQPGDPSDVNKAPIVATGPSYKRRYFKMIIHKKGVRFIPVKREKIKGTHKYKYILKKRQWHYRKNIRRKVIRRRDSRPHLFKKRYTARRNNHGGFLGGLCHRGNKRQQARPGSRRAILQRPIGKVVSRQVTTIHELIIPNPRQKLLHKGCLYSLNRDNYTVSGKLM